MNFLDALQNAIQKNNSLLCLGLDPLPEKFSSIIRSMPHSIFEFNKRIIDATADLVCAYKPQIAHYHAHAAEQQLLMTIDYIKTNYPEVVVILDAKRGDIGSTADQYAKEAFVRYRADAVTVNPYMGLETITPFTAYQDKGVIILCRTSNPSAKYIQNLVLDNGKCLYEVIAEKACQEWNGNNNVLLVVGANCCDELKRIRDMTADMTFLVPGIGAQNNSIEMVMKNGLNQYRQGLVINSSRAILYAGNQYDFADKSRLAAEKLRYKINQLR